MTTLALSMIVRDAASFLPACLESVREIVSELVIADTGSRDATMDIARRAGAQVFSIPWTDDFAEARNLSLAQVTAPWVLSLDADEQLDPAARNALPFLLANNSVHGYQVTIRNYVLSLEDRIWDRPAQPNHSPLPAAKRYPAFVEHENIRLFRRDSRIRFIGRVHESVGPSILDFKGKLQPAPFHIHHFGLALDAETRANKNIFYRQLGRAKLRDMPRNAQAHLELGLLEMDNFQNLPEALRLFERACDLDPKFAVAWFFQGLTLSKTGRDALALRCLDTAERLGHRTSLLAEVRGDCMYNLGRFAEARESYRLALDRYPGNAPLRSKLGLASVRAGDTASGLLLLQKAIESKPQAPEPHDRLILALVWLSRIYDAAAAADAKLRQIPHPAAGDFLRCASLWAQLERWTEASSALNAGLAAHPLDGDLRGATQEVLRRSAVPKRERPL